MKTFIYLIILLISSTTFAQGLARNSEFSPKSPDMSSMQRFDQQTISEYTGKANISIPLVSLPFSNRAINISLDYDSGGIRTNQEASWVGLGWSTNGLPSITRIINGSSDIGSEKIQPNPHGLSQNGLSVSGNPTNQLFVDELESNPIRSSGLYLDTQPDIFTANLLDGSVTFQLSQSQSGPFGDLTGIVLDDSRAIIEFKNSPYEKNFEIIDDNGYRYIFEDKEYASNFYYVDPIPLTSGYWDLLNSSAPSGYFQWNPSQDINNITSWQISRIISPYGEEVKFNYSRDTYDPDADDPNAYLPHVILSTSLQTNSAQIAGSNADGDGGVVSPTNDRQWSRSVLEVKYLEEMVNLSTGERIVFKLGPREDIASYLRNIHITVTDAELPFMNGNTDGSARKLNHIEHYSNTGKIIKYVDFDTGYFNENDSAQTNKDDYLRLKLDRVSIDNQNYEFAYNSPNDLPTKSTSAFDFWGFYNGQGVNSVRSPNMRWDNTMIGGDTKPLLPANFSYSGGNRGSSFTYGQIGSLARITYPTSGYTTYHYESNTISITDQPTFPGYRKYTSMYLEENTNEPGYPKNAISPFQKTYAVGGLRVASIHNYDSNDQLQTRTDFSYDTQENDELQSSGVLIDELLYFSVHEKYAFNDDLILSELRVSSTNKLFPSNDARGSHVGYSRVEIKKIDVFNGVDQGGIIREFRNNFILPSPLGTYHLGIPDNSPFIAQSGNGNVLHETLFDGNNPANKVRETYNTYQYYNVTTGRYGWKPYYSIVIYSLSSTSGSTSGPFRKVYDYFIYPITKNYSLQNSSRVIQYFDNGGEIETVSTYEYDSELQLKKKIVTSPTNDNYEIINEYYYPYSTEYGVAGTQEMTSLKNLNQIGKPVYLRNYRNGNFLGHSLYTFGGFAGKILPTSLKYDPVSGSFSDMDTEITYVDYNSLGKLSDFQAKDGMFTKYIYSNERSDVLAKIVNYNLQAVDPQSLTDISSLDNPLSDSQTLTDQIDLLRTHVDYDTSHITDYLHKSGVGPIQIRNEQEIKMSYLYDDNERLFQVRDFDGNRLKQYHYNMVNTEDTCLNCLPKITLTSSLGYEIFVGQDVSFNRSIPSGYGSISRWEIFYGDESSEEGTGSPPSSFSFQFETLGLKPIRLFTYHSDGKVLSGNLNVRVYEGTIPGADVFFDDITTNSIDEKVATLIGEPGATITYRVTHFPGTVHSGYVGIGGAGYDTLGNFHNETGTITLDASGEASCRVNNYGGTAQGTSIVELRITGTTIGQIAHPNSVSVTRTHL